MLMAKEIGKNGEKTLHKLFGGGEQGWIWSLVVKRGRDV